MKKKNTFFSTSFTKYDNLRCNFKSQAPSDLKFVKKINTTIFLDQKFYTLKMRTSGIFSLTKNQCKCITISNLVLYCVEIYLNVSIKLLDLERAQAPQCQWQKERIFGSFLWKRPGFVQKMFDLEAVHKLRKQLRWVGGLQKCNHWKLY